MAGLKDNELSQIGPWPKGVNNLAPEFSVPSDQLRDAQNVDIQDDGSLVARPGFAKVIDATNAHSAWSYERNLPFALYVDNGELIAFDASLRTTNLRGGLGNMLPLSYEFANDSAYFTNGEFTGRVNAAIELRAWGIESPTGEPLLSANATIGGLDAGAYQVAVSFISDEGEEGGTGLASSITVTQGGGIQLASIPQPLDSHVVFIRVWKSKTNGDILYWHSDVPVGTASLLIGTSQLGKQVETQFFEPMPAGSIVRTFNARIYVAVGRRLYYSEAYRLGLHNPTKYMLFPADITMVQTVRSADIGGLYVSAGSVVYWLGGSDPVGADGATGFHRVSAYASGVVPGSDTVVPGADLGIDDVTTDDVPVWLCENGVFCAGLTDGNVKPITQDRLRLPKCTRAASIYHERTSTRQVVFNMRGIGPASKAAASDTVVATVFRNGVAVD